MLLFQATLQYPTLGRILGSYTFPKYLGQS